VAIDHAGDHALASDGRRCYRRRMRIGVAVARSAVRSIGARLTPVVVLALGCGGDDGAAPVDGAVDAIDATVDAPMCAKEPCSILPQCGCEDTPATPACDLDLDRLSTGDTACRAVRTPGDDSDACTRPNQCAAGFVCTTRCERYCDDDDDCPGPGGLCYLPLLDGTGQPIPGVKLCTTDCDPSVVANPTCPAGWACHLYRAIDADVDYLTNCAPPPATGGQLGDPCAGESGCGPGLECFNDGGGGGSTCHANCRCPGGDCTLATCPAGTGTCRVVSPPWMIGPDSYSICTTF
jgi:hypothetical protein